MTRVESIIGLHADLSVEAYHLDELTPEVSLSSSGIRTLLNETPAHFAARNPRLSQWPDRIERPSREQDLGTIVHALVLGKGAAYDVYDFDDWRKKEAQMMRDASRAEGKVPILRRTFLEAESIAANAIPQLERRFGGWPVGEPEVAMIWKRKTIHGDIWARALMDLWAERIVTIGDLKSTSKVISDDDLRRKIASEGGDIQDAWYTEGIATIFPKFAGLVQFVRMFIEVEPPYSMRFVKLSESWITRARFRIDRAADIFAKCLHSGEWPGYPAGDVALTAPSYLEAKWEIEELAGDDEDEKKKAS